MKVKPLFAPHAWSQSEWDATDAVLASFGLWRAETEQESITVTQQLWDQFESKRADAMKHWPGSAKPYIWFARLTRLGKAFDFKARRITMPVFSHGETAPTPPPSDWVEPWRDFLASLPREEHKVLASIALDCPINPADETRRGVQAARRRKWLRLYQERFPGAGNTNKPNAKTGVSSLAALEECPKGNYSRSVKLTT